MTPAQLEQVRRRFSARTTRPRRMTLPRMREPSDLAYRSDLLDIAHGAQRIIRIDLEPWLAQRLDAPGGDELRALFARMRVKTERLVERVSSGVAARFVRDGERDNRAAMNAQYRTLLRVDPFRGYRGLESTMRARTRENVELIESIPAELLDQVEEVVRPVVSTGVRVEELMKRVRERFEVSDNRAQLIARDQVGKYNGELARERAQSLGVATYVWSTSKDQRVRSDHGDLEGTVQKYAEPPVVDARTGRTGNPGDDYQCRCQALPQVAALLDALEIPDEIDVVEDDSSDTAQ